METEDLTSTEMLAILSELGPRQHIWRSSKNGLLNFIEKIRE